MEWHYPIFFFDGNLDYPHFQLFLDWSLQCCDQIYQNKWWWYWCILVVLCSIKLYLFFSKPSCFFVHQTMTIIIHNFHVYWHGSAFSRYWYIIRRFKHIHFNVPKYEYIGGDVLVIFDLPFKALNYRYFTINTSVYECFITSECSHWHWHSMLDS